MSIAQTLLKELQHESAVTRRYLERIPFDKRGFQPHEKSEELIRLAIHLAEITAWWTSCIKENELDFIDFEPKDIQSSEELLNYFDGLLAEAIETLQSATDEDMEGTWSMRHGEEVYFTLPKKQVARIYCMNHMVHHRAQLGVYLRLLGIPIPATYGPSEDDYEVTLIHPF